MPPRDIRMYMHDIVEACRSIEQAVAGHTLETYRNNRQLRSAVEREFITIGEALRRASHLDDSLDEIIPELPLIIGFRNNLVHQYEVVDDAVVWQTVMENLPLLRTKSQRILDQYSGGRG